MEFRTLAASERGALLDLLDRWPLPDGWRGRDFFRRYVDEDPTFHCSNVWVATEDGILASCVQIFPRAIRLGDATVPLGGIGSVFTAPEFRRQGIAGALLERAVGAMTARGMELSLLFAVRIPWYTQLGWESWRLRRDLLRGPGRPGETAVVRFERKRDLEAVRDLHERYSAVLQGTAVRDAALWEASLRNAGNPDEDFLVARTGGRVVAYARATVMERTRIVTEFGRAEGASAALADTLARIGGKLAVAPDLSFDAELVTALEAREVRLAPVWDESTMLRCLDGPALARRLGLEPLADASPNAFLRTVLPPERFLFWVADRF